METAHRLDGADMSWWKRAISEDAINDKLNKLYEQHEEGDDWGKFSSPATEILARYVDGIPQAQELMERKLKTLDSLQQYAWIRGYLDHVASTGNTPSWLLRLINQKLDVGEYGSGSSMARLLASISPVQIDEALARTFSKHGSIPSIFRFTGVEGSPIKIERDMPKLYAEIVRSVQLNLLPKAPDALLRDALNDESRPTQKLTAALSNMIENTGCVPVYAYDWMERNLAPGSSSVSPGTLQQWGEGIVRAFKRNNTICPAAIPWFNNYMMNSRDENLWRSVMFSVLTPGISPKTTQRLRNNLGPAIAHARKTGVLSETYDNQVMRLVTDYMTQCWNTGCETARSLDPWVFNYLLAAPIRDRLRHQIEMTDYHLFPLEYFDKKMSELEAHAKEQEALIWI